MSDPRVAQDPLAPYQRDTSTVWAFKQTYGEHDFSRGTTVHGYKLPDSFVRLLEAHGPLDLPSPEYEHSEGPLPATPPTPFEIWPSFFNRDHAAAQLSLISHSLHTATTAPTPHLEIRLVVLSSDVGWI